MYKSMLQEMCQKRSWRLPEYSTEKHGLDHCPSFSATVTLNDLSFHTLSLSKSSRDAQNDAAKLAFHHFCSSSTKPFTPHSDSFPQPSLSVVAEENPTESTDFIAAEVNPVESTVVAVAEANPEESRIVAAEVNPVESRVVAAKSTGQQNLYKSQLQIYAQKRNLMFPVYSSEREGPPHAARFKCHVTVDGRTFRCSEFFPTVKEAENAAAELALASMPSDGEVDSIIYKNLLQEIVQKEGVPLPYYETQGYGQVHSPVFVSTVQVSGERFSGEEAKTKKLAEISAAKVAYNALKDRKSKLIQNPLSSATSQQGRKTTQLLASSAPSNILTKSFQMLSIKDSSSTSNGCTSNGSKLKTTDGSSSPLSSEGSDVDSSCLQSSPKMTLAYKNIIVYPATKEVPNGSTLLPFSDKNWNAFSPREAQC